MYICDLKDTVSSGTIGFSPKVCMRNAVRLEWAAEVTNEANQATLWATLPYLENLNLQHSQER